MKSRSGWISALVVLVALMLPAVAGAQTTLGRVAGTVLDESGGVLPGATVTLTNLGTAQVLTTASGDTGAFLFAQVPVGKYKINISLDGFKAAEYTDVEVSVGQEYSLTSKLAVGAMTELVTVTAGSSLVQTTTPEVTSTVMQRQVLGIPLANRDIANLIKLQPGVAGISNRTNTVINGGRPTWTQITLDGISVQDNFIRTNSLDFLPNRPTSDNVAEFTITTSVAGAEAAGGATSIRMVTPGGTNRFTGSLYGTNRDAKFAANSFFNNASRVPKPVLSRNQVGGRVGGPVKRDKLFFFFNYEAFRQTSQASQNLVIPANADFYNGVFRYVDLSGNIQSVNVLQLSGLPADAKLRTDVFSKIAAPSNVNNFDVGNSTAARNLNTAGYRFNQTDLNNRDGYTGRLDFSATRSHSFETVFSYFKETDDRTDIDLVTPSRPQVATFSDPKRLALAWRWVASSNFNNELRGGGNISPALFLSAVDFSAGVIYNPNLGITNPVPTFQSQGRYTDTYQISDNASYVRGSHQMQMGGSWQRNKVNAYNFAGQYPSVNFGFSPAAPTSIQLNSAQFPGGIAPTDLASANAAAAFLGGIVTQVGQTFQVRDGSSGFVPGLPSDENYTLDNIAAYVQDNWRWKPNFTIRGGLKWEYYAPLREDNNLGLLPITNGRGLKEALLDPNTRVGLANGDFYKKDLNNFGPTIGFAWDVTRDGKTAVRGGYSLTFVNEETVGVGRGVGRGNVGLTTGVTLTNQFATVSGGVPTIPSPAFLPERGQADQLGLSTSAIITGLDPNLKAPHVHQASIGVQRELPWSTALEVRYVGSFGRGIWRGIDYNQVQISQSFLDDFKRARSNGFLAQQAGLAFSPVFNPAVPGSQPLTVLPNFGLLTNQTAISQIQTNQVAGLADLYITGSLTAAERANARATFLQNPGIYAANGIINGGFSDYNSLQVELRRQFRNGFFAQVNYTLADSNTNSSGQGQNRFEAFQDNNRPELNIGRAPFHVTHVMNANAILELPFGRDRKWLNGGGLTDILVGGWQLGSIVAWQSGSPVSIVSGRGTFNRAGRSNCGTPIGCNTAVTNLSVSQVQDLFGIFKLPDGRIFFINPKVIDPATGRAVGADNLGNTAGFPGQVFFNPGAGEVGNLPILAFNGPSVARVDISLSKKTRITGRYNIELKGEAFNVTNTPNFFAADQDINSPLFGRLRFTTIENRIIQFSARLNF